MLMVVVAAGVLLTLAVVVLPYPGPGGIPEEATRSMDLRMMDIVYRWRSPTLTRAMIVVTNLGAAFPIAVLVLVMIPAAWRTRRKEVLALAVIFIVGVLIHTLLKEVAQRPRPAIAPLVDAPGYGFPSGHAMNAFVFYSAVALFCCRFLKRKMLGLPVVLLAAGIVIMTGFSRVYLGEHYPSDVLAGYVIGAWWLAVALLIGRSAGLEGPAIPAGQNGSKAKP
jgi:undecaprenyl-diphosphatase